ncbi:MAG: hypothetical protein IJU02_07025 [Lachnospiraceae bacterium]|nr:hypothetical protein [Lachnospiraceae bacterium]
MPGIKFSSDSSKMPRTAKLASYISSYLFEEQYGECEKLKSTTIKNLKAICVSLLKAANKG